MNSSASPFSQFFSTFKDDSTLVFTTFSLDEWVFLRLLREHKVKDTMKIIVYHDCARHKHPGLLRADYPESTVVSITLPPQRGYRCPVFHSKVWMAIGTNLQITRMAVGSVNLSRYHLGKGTRNVRDTFRVWDGTDLSLPDAEASTLARDMRKRLTQTSPKSQMIGMAPDTWQIVLDKYGSPATITVHHESVLEIIRPDIPTVIACAAPFISAKTLQTTGFPGTAVVYGHHDHKDASSASKVPDLHAKFIEWPASLLWGSPNLTKQGLGAEGIVNHETIVCESKPSTDSVALDNLRGMGYKPRDLESLAGQSADEQHTNNGKKACDSDGTSWDEARRNATNGPESVVLEIDKTQKPILRVSWAPKRKQLYRDKLELTSVGERHTLRADRNWRVPVERDKAKWLAHRIEARDLIEVTFTSRKKGPSVTIPLDLGEFWEIVVKARRLQARQQPRRRRPRNATEGAPGGSNGSHRDVRQVLRDLWNRTGARTHGSHRVTELQAILTSWMAGSTQSQNQEPAWCRTLVQGIRTHLDKHPTAPSPVGRTL